MTADGDKYFSALALENSPDWMTAGGHIPHITMHYFGAIGPEYAAQINAYLQNTGRSSFRLMPKALERFGDGWAMTFKKSRVFGSLCEFRAMLAAQPVISELADTTYPDFVPHLSLPGNMTIYQLPNDLISFTGVHLYRSTRRTERV